MEADPSTWLVLLDKAIIPLVVLFLTPVLSALANRAIAALQEKTKLALSAQQQAAFHQILDEAIHFAEEQAHKAVRKDNAKLTGSTKMEQAIGYIQTKSKVLQLDDIADAKTEELAHLIEAKLFQARVDPTSGVKPPPSRLNADGVPETAPILLTEEVEKP